MIGEMTKEKLNVLFDAKILLNYKDKGSSRSGIFSFTYNVFKEFLKREDVNIVLWTETKNLYALSLLKRELFPEARLFYDLPKKYEKIFKLKYSLDCLWTANLARPFVRKPIALCRLIYENVLNTFFLKKQNKKINSYDFFFESFETPPKIVRKSSQIRCCSVLHDAIPFLFSYMGESFKQGIWKQIELSHPRDIFFCVSENTKQDYCRLFSKLGDENTKALHLAANLNFRPVKNDNERFQVLTKYRVPHKRYIFSLCTLEPRKNLVRAVRCFMRFVQKNHIEDLVWVMGGGHWDSFVKELQKNGVAWDPKYIVQAGYIDDEDLPVLYSNAEWFVYTSQYEGFGLPPLEAMQCGCPVVTSNNSSLPEVVGDAGIMIDWDSDEQHIKAYEQYYFNEELRKENSRKGLERAKRFSWEKTVDEMVKVMKKELFSYDS